MKKFFVKGGASVRRKQREAANNKDSELSEKVVERMETENHGGGGGGGPSTSGAPSANKNDYVCMTPTIRRRINNTNPSFLNATTSTTGMGRCESWSPGTKVSPCLNSLQQSQNIEYEDNKLLTNRLSVSTNGGLNDEDRDDPHPFLDRSQSASAHFFSSVINKKKSSTTSLIGGHGGLAMAKSLCGQTTAKSSKRSPSQKSQVESKFAADVNRHLYTTLVGVLLSKSKHLEVEEGGGGEGQGGGFPTPNSVHPFGEGRGEAGGRGKMCRMSSVCDSMKRLIRENAAKKRAYVMKELVKTEQDYVSDLRSIVEGYMVLMRDSKSSDLGDDDGGVEMPEDLRGGRDKIVFGNLKTIYEWHRDVFCKGLEACVESPVELAHFFKKHESRLLHLYVVYCQNKPKSEHIVFEHIHTYFEDLREELGHTLTLNDLLIKPVQRVMRYELLLKDVLKYTERIGVKEEIEAMREACQVMHLVPKEANNMMSVGRLQGFDDKITAQGKLLLFGKLWCCEQQRTPSVLNFRAKLQVFVFEQKVIFSESVGRKTKFSNPAYVYKAHIPVNNLSLTESVDDGDARKFLLQSTDHKRPVSFLCQASSRESRDEWINTLQQVLTAQQLFIDAILDPIEYQKRLRPRAKLERQRTIQQI